MQGQTQTAGSRENLLMNRRERLRRCYFNEELDRPGVYSRTLFPEGDPSYDKLRAYLAAHTELKHTWPAVQIESDYPMDVVIKLYSDDLVRQITTLHTPKGDLESRERVRIKGHDQEPNMAESYMLKNRQDAEKYLSLPMPEVGGDVNSFFKAKKQVGTAGIVDVDMGANPAGLAATLFGPQQFAIMSVTNRDIIHRLCERRMTIMLNRLKYLFSKGVGPFFSTLGEELVCPPLHSPKDFREFNVKYDKPIIDLIHSSGGRIHIHCHGSIKKVLQDFIDMGIDVLHPFEAPTMGDILPGEAKDIARGKLCLEGNIQIDRMYNATPEEIREETQLLIEAAFDDHKGLIVSPTASPYIYGKGEDCFPQYKAMIDTVLGWAG